MQPVPEQKAVVFPMVKHPFVVGFLVAELPMTEMDMGGNKGIEGGDMVTYQTPEEVYALPPGSDLKSWDIDTFDNGRVGIYKFTPEQRSNAISICQSLAMAYVMDQVDSCVFIYGTVYARDFVLV